MIELALFIIAAAIVISVAYAVLMCSSRNLI